MDIFDVNFESATQHNPHESIGGVASLFSNHDVFGGDSTGIDMDREYHSDNSNPPIPTLNHSNDNPFIPEYTDPNALQLSLDNQFSGTNAANANTITNPALNPGLNPNEMQSSMGIMGMDMDNMLVSSSPPGVLGMNRNTHDLISSDIRSAVSDDEDDVAILDGTRVDDDPDADAADIDGGSNGQGGKHKRRDTLTLQHAFASDTSATPNPFTDEPTQSMLSRSGLSNPTVSSSADPIPSDSPDEDYGHGKRSTLDFVPVPVGGFTATNFSNVAVLGEPGHIPSGLPTSNVVSTTTSTSDGHTGGKHQDHRRMATDDFGGFVGFDDSGAIKVTGQQPTVQDHVEMLERGQISLRQQILEKDRIITELHKELSVKDKTISIKERIIEHLITKFPLKNGAEPSSLLPAKDDLSPLLSSDQSSTQLSKQAHAMIESTVNDNMKLSQDIQTLKAYVSTQLTHSSTAASNILKTADALNNFGLASNKQHVKVRSHSIGSVNWNLFDVATNPDRRQSGGSDLIALFADNGENEIQQHIRQWTTTDVEDIGHSLNLLPPHSNRSTVSSRDPYSPTQQTTNNANFLQKIDSGSETSASSQFNHTQPDSTLPNTNAIPQTKQRRLSTTFGKPIGTALAIPSDTSNFTHISTGTSLFSKVKNNNSTTDNSLSIPTTITITRHRGLSAPTYSTPTSAYPSGTKTPNFKPTPRNNPNSIGAVVSSATTSESGNRKEKKIQIKTDNELTVSDAESPMPTVSPIGIGKTPSFQTMKSTAPSPPPMTPTDENDTTPLRPHSQSQPNAHPHTHHFMKGSTQRDSINIEEALITQNNTISLQSQQISHLKSEIERIVESKMTLVLSTATEITRLKQFIGELLLLIQKAGLKLTNNANQSSNASDIKGSTSALLNNTKK